MKVDVDGIEAFLAVAELGSFHRAASYLNLSKTAVSHRVRKIEGSLGVKLFNRTTKQVSLTEAGGELLPAAKRALGELQGHLELICERHRETQSSLRIACMPTFAAHYLGPVFADFRAKYPEATIRILDASATEVAQAVARGLSEIGLATLATNRLDLAYEPLVTESYSLLCRNDDDLVQAGSITWDDLSRRRLIRMAADTAYRLVLDEALGPRAERMDWLCEVQHTTTALMLVSEGYGYVVLPPPPKYYLESLRLTCLDLSRPRASHTVSIVASRSTAKSLMAQEFIRILKAHVGRPARSTAVDRIDAKRVPRTS